MTVHQRNVFQYVAGIGAFIVLMASLYTFQPFEPQVSNMLFYGIFLVPFVVGIGASILLNKGKAFAFGFAMAPIAFLFFLALVFIEITLHPPSEE